MPRETNSSLKKGSAADRIVKSMKKEAAQDNLNHSKLGEEELSNTLQFKYLGVMQAADGDLWPSLSPRGRSRGLVL